MSAWGGPPSSGAWANQVDEEEAANGGELDPVPGVTTPFPSLGQQNDSSFPSLGDSLTVKESKKERRKKQGGVQKMSLGNFMAAGKENEKIDLPTRPRERAEGEEDRRGGGLGGGFKNYGGDRGGFDRDSEGGFRGGEEVGPSRADAADDWGTKKAFVPSGPSRGGFGDRGGGFGSGGFRDRERPGGGFSERYGEKRAGFAEGGDPYRADDADKWASKSFEPSSSRKSGVFESRDRERYGGFKDDFGGSKADTEDRWARREEQSNQTSGPPSGSRPRLNLQPRSADLPTPELPPPSTSSRQSEASNEEKELTLPATRSGPRSNPFGNAKPVSVKDILEKEKEKEPEANVSRDEKEESKEEIKSDPVPQPSKPRSNPFGSARPREEVLKEKASQNPTEDETLSTSDASNPLEKSENPEKPQDGAEKTGKLESEKEEKSELGVPPGQHEDTVKNEEKVNESGIVSGQISEASLQKTEGAQRSQTPSEPSILNQTKEVVSDTVEKLSSAITRLTSKDKAEEDEKSSKEPQESSKDQEQFTKETPKSPVQEAKSKSSEIRPGASWANIARGPSSTPVEST